MGLPMLRGEIRLADLDPARSGEANTRRPAVIVSNDRANASAARLGRGVVTIVPVTSNVEQVYPFQVLLAAEETGLRVDSKAQGEQIRSVSVETPSASTSSCDRWPRRRVKPATGLAGRRLAGGEFWGRLRGERLASTRRSAGGP